MFNWPFEVSNFIWAKGTWVCESFIMSITKLYVPGITVLIDELSKLINWEAEIELTEGSSSRLMTWEG